MAKAPAERWGETQCLRGRIVDDCQPGQPARLDLSCDGVDDDCDGRVDEDFRSQDIVCGQGVCQREGVTACVNGNPVSICDTGEPIEGPDGCDGRDSDCDGEVDEDFLPRGILCGVGECQAMGETQCLRGREDASCDGLDNDCDGRIDEDFVARPITCGLGSQRDGNEVCAMAQRSGCRS